MENKLNDFLHYIKYIEPKSELTVSSYQSDLMHYIEYLKNEGIKLLEDVSFNEINLYLRSLKDDFSLATIQHRAVSIRQFHQYLLQMGILKTNPSQYLDVKSKGKTIPKIISEETVNLLLDFPILNTKDQMDHTILMLLYHSGLRVSELCNLSFNQVYLDERWLRILGKGSKERFVPISLDSAKTLKSYLDQVRPFIDQVKSELIFLNKKGKPISRQYVHTMIKYRCKQQNIKENVSAHSLRHRFATSFLETGVDLRFIQELLGHVDISTTQIYTHVDIKTMRNEYDRFFSDGFDNKGESKE